MSESFFVSVYIVAINPEKENSLLLWTCSLGKFTPEQFTYFQDKYFDGKFSFLLGREGNSFFRFDLHSKPNEKKQRQYLTYARKNYTLFWERSGNQEFVSHYVEHLLEYYPTLTETKLNLLWQDLEYYQVMADRIRLTDINIIKSTLQPPETENGKPASKISNRRLTSKEITKRIRAKIEFIQNNPELTLKDLAATIGVSLNTLRKSEYNSMIKKFRQVTMSNRETPTEYKRPTRKPKSSEINSNDDS